MKRYLTLVFAVLLLSTGLSAHAKDMYGALAFSEDDGAWGWSADYATKAKANRVAMDKCQENGESCKVVLTFWNTCAAFANGDGGHGWAYDNNIAKAKKRAIKECNKYASDCEVKVWACTTR